MVKKLATAALALPIIKQTDHQFNSGIHPCCDTHYLFLRMGSFEFVTYQRWGTFMVSRVWKTLTKSECHVPAGKSVSIVSLI